ncbi:MAG: twin transmembrane helix small protein [Alphaproteobacteria bacterium]
MATVLAILIGVTLLAVVAVLVAGVLGMARGGEFNKRHGNTLMRYRVGLQFLAVVLIVLLVLVVRGGT